MNILIMVHSLTGGGAERVAALWASGFANRGDSVTLVTQDLTFHTYDLSSKVAIVNINIPIKNKCIRKLLAFLYVSREHYLWRLNKILHEINPDVIIGVMGSYARDAFKLTEDMDSYVIQTYHSSFDLPMDAPKQRIRDIRKCYEMDACVKARTVLTMADKQHIGDRMNNVYVMPNPLSFNPLDRVPKKEKVILACGRLDVWDVKGFDLLIKSWGKIAANHPGWKLQIAGTGKKESIEFLMNLAKVNHLTHQIELMGFREDIVELYKKAEIFVLSSRYEGFGMVLIEAMSQGCACIACDYKGRQKEIIENDSQGIIIPSGEIEPLSFAIQKMILDTDYRKECQKNAIKRSSYFSLDNTMQRWEKLFENIGVGAKR